MKIKRSMSSLVVAAGLALASLGMAGAAQAQNVNWSLGLYSPGVQLGLTNAQPMYIQQPMYQPVYQEVYRAPRPMVYVRPPVYVAQPQYVEVGWNRPGWRWREGHGRRDGHRFDGEDSGRGHRDHHRD